MKKIIFFITLFYFIAACSSVKRLERSCKEIPFEELDSLTRANVVLNYKLEVPKEWVKSKFSGGDWYYIQGDYIESLGYHKRKADFYVSKNNIRNDCKAKTDYSVKDFLKYYIDYKSRWYRENSFKYVLLKSKHKIYGDIFILKYKFGTKSTEYTSSTFLFFYNIW